MHYNNRHMNQAPASRPQSFANDYRDYSYYEYTPQNHYYPQSSSQVPQQRRNDYQHQYDRPGPSKNQNFGQPFKEKSGQHREKSNFVPVFNPSPNPYNDDYKIYICPGCSLHFDSLSRNNRYMGRVPLILNCHHTLCQECIYKGAVVDNINCPICKQTSEVSKKHLVDNVQEAFPPNYYLFGLIMWAKPGSSQRQPVLMPAQVTLSKKRLSSIEPASEPTPEIGEICCFVSCNKSAVLRCQDCNDVYCVDCCTVVHKSAKSLWCHVQVPISKDKFSADLEKCPDHNMDVELYCRTCEADACCYCFLDKHEGHERDFLSKLNDVEMSEFRTYKNSAEKILRQLLISQKKLKTLCSSSTKSVENKICSYFANLHADFYLIQKKLQKQIATLDGVGKSDSGLDSIGSDLSKSIDTMKSLIVSADSTNQKKMNIRGLLQRLREVQNMPCYLLTEDGTSSDPIEFKADPILKNAEELFVIKRIEDCNFMLVGEAELPPDYVVDPVEESDAESCISSLLSSYKREDVNSISGRTNTSLTTSNITKLGPQKKKKVEAKQMIKSHLQVPSDNECVEVTHIESLECFYVQLKKTQSRFMQMNKDIENFIKMGASPVDHPQINELYLVMYVTKNDKTWCRGRITDIKEGSKPLYEVFFIDYGSTQAVTGDKLREITPNLAQRKPFAIQCELYNPTFANWGKNAHVYMGKMINGKNVYMMVKSITNGIYQVDLMVSSSDKGLTSIIDILIHTCSNALSSSSDSSSVISQRKDTFVPESKVFSNSIKFQKNQIENVMLANIIDPHHIFVHVAAYVDALRKMAGEMKYHYKNTGYESCIPLEGTYVVVEHKDPIRGTWHRALVKKVDMNSAKAHVLLVDWGSNVVVPWSSIRLLSDSFTRLESQAILVKLADVEPYNSQSWSEKATFFLQRNFRTQDVLKMIVYKEDPLEVALFEKSCNADICINAQLVKEKLAESTGKISKTLVWPQNEAGQPDFNEDEGFVATLLKKVYETLDDDSEDEEVTALVKQQIEVVKMVSPDLIYIKFPHLEQQEQTLHKQLQIFYQKERQQKETWEEHEDCVVIFTDSYYRGKILRREGDKYRVNVYDRATETVLSKDKIFVYADYFRKYPNVVFKSHLANIRPAGGDNWSLSSIEALERVFEKHKDMYGTRVKGDVSRKSMPMLMWYAQVEVGGALEPSVTKFVSINGLLVKMGMAYKIPVSKLRIGDDERVREEGKVEMTVSALVHAPDDGLDKGLDGSGSTEQGSEKEQKTNDETKEKSSLDSSNQTNVSVDWMELMEKEENDDDEEPKKDSPYHTRETEIVDWKPPFPIKKREFNAWITCAETDGILYLRDEDLQAVYKDMEANLKQYFDSKPTATKSKADWRPGQICTISYKDYWYRGKILKVEGPDEIVAVMIDFGSDHVLKPTQLHREILYPEIPAFASRIKLHKLFAVSGTWLDSDYEMLLENITEYAKVAIKGPLEVDTPQAEVYLQNGESINQILANICPNLTRSLKPEPQVADEDTVVIEKEEPLEKPFEELLLEEPLATPFLSLENDIESQSADNDTTDMEFQVDPLPDIALKQKTPMPIVAVLSHNKIVIKKTKESEEDLYELSEKIQDAYAAQPVIKDIKLGTPCICPYSDDDLWYRGKVHNIDGIDCGYVFVFYVDFGNVESVATKDIRAMRREWFDMPISCYIATLNFELRSDNHVEHVLQHVKKLYEKIKLVEIVSDDPLTVNLYEQNGELCYQSLVNGGLLMIN